MSEQDIEARSLRDLLIARADGQDVPDEKIRVLRREDELVRAALAYPKALLSSGVIPSMFEGADYGIAWSAAIAASATMPSASGDPLSNETVLAEMRRRNEQRFAGPSGLLWMASVTAQKPVEIGYALDVLAKEMIARHHLRVWRHRTGKLNEQIDSTKDILGLHEEYITESLGISISPDGGRLGELPEDLPWDAHNRSNPNIVPSGFGKIDKAAGGGHGRGDLGVIGGGTNHGKCMRKGTPVVMYDGTLKVVEDVVVGDVLLGPDGGPRCVLSTNQGVGDMYEIRPNWKGKRWVVNFDHILTLVGTGSAEKNRWGEQIIDVPLREWWTWSKKKKHNFKLLRASALEFGGAAKVELPIEPYFLGVLLGDGSMQQSTPLVTTADDEIVREVHRQAKLWGLSVSKHHNDKKLCPSYGIHGGTRGGRVPNPLMAALSSLGLRGHSSDDKFIPQIYKTASMRDRREIFAGLIDTDGSRNMTGFDYVTKSKTLADDVAFVARSLGMAALVSRSMKRAQTGPIREYWRVNITGDAVTTIPCRLERKRITERRHFRNALHVGFKVVPTGTVETFYGFTLDGDSRYLLDDFTITHNSYFAQRYLRNQARLGRSVLYISVEDPQELMFCRMLADFSSPKLRPVHIRQKLADPRVVEQARLAMSAELRGLVRYVIRKKATVAEVCQIIRRHRFMVGIDSVVIDYLQAVQPNKTTNNKTQDTAFIVSELKKCFEDCGVAGWVLSQYARDGYREGAEPNIQACKYAGDIENESEIMCLLWRDDEGRLHAKLPKVKWSQAQGLRYIIDTDESGCLLDWQDDFEQPQEDQEPRRGGGKKGQQR